MKMDFSFAFDGKPIMSAADRAERKILMGFGGYVRAIARNSIKKGQPAEKSQAGTPPVGHANELYKNFISFAHDPTSHSVVIGSELLSGTQGEFAPGVIEYGGEEEVYVGRRDRRHRERRVYAPRPALRLAYEKAVEKFLPKLIENSITPSA